MSGAPGMLLPPRTSDARTSRAWQSCPFDVERVDANRLRSTSLVATGAVWSKRRQGRNLTQLIHIPDGGVEALKHQSEPNS